MCWAPSTWGMRDCTRRRRMIQAGRPCEAQRRSGRIGGVLVLGTIGLLAASGRLELTAERISAGLGVVLILVSVAIFGWLLLGPGWSITERKRSGAILVLFVASAVFWAAYEQGGSSLNLFAERSTRHVVLGFDFPPSWFRFVPGAFRDTSGAGVCMAVDRAGQTRTVHPTKSAFGLLFGAIAFAILVPPARAAMAVARVGCRGG